MVKLVDLVKTVRKRSLLAYIGLSYSEIGFVELSAGWGYDSLPGEMKNVISKEVFAELMEQLLGDKLITTYNLSMADSYPADQPIVKWKLTSRGKRVLVSLIPNLDEVKNDKRRRSLKGAVELLRQLHFMPASLDR